MEDSFWLPVVNGFQMVELLGNFKDTMKTDCSDLWIEESLLYTKFCEVLQKSRTKDDKISTSDMTVDTWFLFTSKLVRDWEFILRNWRTGMERTNLFLSTSKNNIFNCEWNREVKSTETNKVNKADHCLVKNCQQSGNGDGRAVRS